MRKILLLAVFSLLLMPHQAKAATIEDGAELCTKKDCKMLLNILPTPISSVPVKKTCKVTWAVRPDLFSTNEPLPKKGCKTYMSQNLGRWTKEHQGSGPAPWPPKVFLEPIPITYDTWR
jgi:hypothetical protein